MKYRIREERYGIGSSKFYTERWHEPYEQWVKAMNCEFYNLSDAKEALDLYHKNYMSCFEPSEAKEIIPEYTPLSMVGVQPDTPPWPRNEHSKPPLMRVGCNGNPCPLCGSGTKSNWLFFKSKGCYQSECENYWRNK